MMTEIVDNLLSYFANWAKSHIMIVNFTQVKNKIVTDSPGSFKLCHFSFLEIHWNVFQVENVKSRCPLYKTPNS